MSAMCVTMGVQRPACVKTHAIKRCTRFDPIYIFLPSNISPPRKRMMDAGCRPPVYTARRITRRVPLRSSTSNVGHSLCTRYSFFSFSRYAFALDNEHRNTLPSIIPSLRGSNTRPFIPLFFFSPFFFAKLIDLSSERGIDTFTA